MSIAPLLIVWMLTLPAAAQDPPPPAPGVLAPAVEPHPITVHLISVAKSLPTLAGKYLLVRNVRITRVINPYAFVIEQPQVAGTADSEDSRSLVVTALPAPVLKVGDEITVVGTAYTLLGARAQARWPAHQLPDLSDEFGERPVFLADRLQTPGGVELYSGVAR